VYDTQGNLRLYSRYGVGPQVLTQDIQTLLKTTPRWWADCDRVRSKQKGHHAKHGGLFL